MQSEGANENAPDRRIADGRDVVFYIEIRIRVCFNGAATRYQNGIRRRYFSTTVGISRMPPSSKT